MYSVRVVYCGGVRLHAHEPRAVRTYFCSFVFVCVFSTCISAIVFVHYYVSRIIRIITYVSLSIVWYSVHSSENYMYGMLLYRPCFLRGTLYVAKYRGGDQHSNINFCCISLFSSLISFSSLECLLQPISHLN